MSGTALLTQIESKMASLIEGIKAEPYNFVWGKCNERDMAKAMYPSAVIYIENETSVDDPDGVWAQEYANEVTFRIEVRARLDAQYENPVVEIRTLLLRALDDLKLLFGRNYNLDGTCDTIMYRGMTIVEEPSGDIFIPSKLVSVWLVRYEQDRLSPTTQTQ